jgi:hypothetical protein
MGSQLKQGTMTNGGPGCELFFAKFLQIIDDVAIDSIYSDCRGHPTAGLRPGGSAAAAAVAVCTG